MRPRIPIGRVAVLVVQRPIVGKPIGGAEAIADLLIQQLQSARDVVVFHGFDPKRSKPGIRGSGTPLSFVSAFPITESIRERGFIPLERLVPDARTELATCSVLLEFERVLVGEIKPLRIAVLGGTAYPHCRDVGESTFWDFLVVPSDFVREEVVRKWHGPKDRVIVVPNGVDNKLFCPDNSKGAGNLQFLLPARPDWGKGFLEAVALVRAYREFRRDVRLVCPVQPAARAFHLELRRRASDIEIREYPWRPRSAMPAIYRDSDLTLCPGQLPEGFCLAAVESIACGTPVLGRARGFLPRLVPEHHGLALTDAWSPRKLASLVDSYLPEWKRHCLERGRPFVAEHYSESAMVAGFANLLDALK